MDFDKSHSKSSHKFVKLGQYLLVLSRRMSEIYTVWLKTNFHFVDQSSLAYYWFTTGCSHTRRWADEPLSTKMFLPKTSHFCDFYHHFELNLFSKERRQQKNPWINPSNKKLMIRSDQTFQVKIDIAKQWCGHWPILLPSYNCKFLVRYNSWGQSY